MVGNLQKKKKKKKKHMKVKQR